MATNQPFSQDFEALLSCSICHERYRSPKLLACHHTFCYGCLEKWHSQQPTPTNREIKCPECNQITSLNASNVAGLHANFYLEGILDMLSKGAKLIIDPEAVACDICQEEKSDFVCAQKYCNDCGMNMCASCTEKHGAHTAFNHHRVSETCKKATEPVSAEEMICPLHLKQKNLVQSSCHSCSQLLCRICLFNHDPEHKIDAFKVAALEESHQKLKEYKHILNEKLSQVNHQLSENYENGKKSRALEGVQNAIKKRADHLVDELTAKVRDWEKQLIGQAETALDKMVQHEKMAALAFKSRLEEILSDVEVNLQGPQENAFFKCSELGDQVLEVGDTPDSDFASLTKFTPSDDGLGYGELKIYSPTIKVPPPAPLPSPKQRSKRLDKYGPIAFHVNGISLVCLYSPGFSGFKSRQSVSVFDAFGNFKSVLCSKVDVYHKFVSLCYMDQDLAVTDSKSILVLLEKHKFSIEEKKCREFKAHEIGLMAPHGLAYSSWYLIVSDILTHSVCKLDTISGKVMWRVGGYGNGDVRFICPSFVTSCNYKIYVSDSGNQSIKCFNGDGKHIKTWLCKDDEDNIFSPFGIAVHESGYMLVADYENNRIMKRSTVSDEVEGFFRPHLTELDGISKPRNVCLHPSGLTLVQNEGNESVLLYNFIQTPGLKI